jgi:hypothetical protein
MSVVDWITKAKAGADMVGVLVAAIETIATVFKQSADKEHKIRVVEDVIRNVQAGWRGDMKPEQIRAEFAKHITKTEADTDAAADAAADAKFGKKK